MSRRTFGRLAGVAACALLPLSLPARAEAQEAPAVTETDEEIVVDNGQVVLTIDKSNGRATSLVYGGRNLVGRGNFDMNTTREGGGLPLPPGELTFEVRQEADFVDVAFRHPPTGDLPCWLTRHHIVRTGESGIHLANTFEHPEELHGFRTDQHHYVVYTAGDTFTHAWVEDDPIGEPWRSEAAKMPTPGEMSQAAVVMDATYDLEGTGTDYPRRYYTKYDWAVYMKEHALHGLYGNGYGMWAALPNLEAFSGGPVRQDLILHQRTGGPVLLVEPHATHYGAPPVRVSAGQEWQKTYGPYYVHLNRGDDPQQLYEDAAQYAVFDAHAEFYDRLALPGWTPRADRSTVSGIARIPGVHRWDGAVAVLSDNRTPMQDTVLGYNYWSDIERGGRFEIDHVRPGTYRLTLYGDGIWGEHVIDDVEIGAGQHVRLGAMQWETEEHGQTVFQIGSPNRTSVEFRNGAQFRQYGLYQQFHEDFPDGVTYTVGESDESDWNYIQYQRAYRIEAPDGTVVPDGAEGVHLFDFGSASSPLAPGYQRVADDLLYSAGEGYGLDQVVDSRSRDDGGPLLQDFTVGADYAFVVDLPDGEYEVTVHSGDAIAANNTQLSIDGGPTVDLSAASGEYASHTTTVQVDSGRLELTTGGDGRINAVEILAADAAVPVLEALSIDGTELVPEFSAFRSDFAADVAHDVEAVTVRAEGRAGAEVTVAGQVVPEEGLVVPLTGRRTEIELEVAGDGEPTTYRLHVTTQESPWRILFDLPHAPAPEAQVTLSVWLAAWAMGAALPVPPEESNLTIEVNQTPFTWTFQPDDARGATYRSGCGGEVFRREITFDGAVLRRGRNEISLQINKDAAHLYNEAAYDAIRLQIAD